VSIAPGTYRLGPSDGALSVRTGRTGAAAKAGHDLLLEVTAWKATLNVAAEGSGTSLELDADATSLRVREGTGGMQALGDEERASIVQSIDDDVLQREDITFRSSSVDPAGDDALAVAGELTLRGTARRVSFELAVGDGGALTATVVVTQSAWGMKPFSILFGALKVADDVTVAVDVRLPAAQSR
jgi:polyisoprenoid-binding protein YceI